jgi:hypothetical protein
MPENWLCDVDHAQGIMFFGAGAVLAGGCKHPTVAVVDPKVTTAA